VHLQGRGCSAGLYKGVTLSAAGIVPYLAVSFAVYDELKAMLPNRKAARLEWWYPVAKIGIGAMAAVVAQARQNPDATRCAHSLGCAGRVPSGDAVSQNLVALAVDAASKSHALT